MTIIDYAKAGKPCWVLIDPPFGSKSSPEKLQEAFAAVGEAMKAHPGVLERKVKTLIEVALDRDYVSHKVFDGAGPKPAIGFGEYVTHLTP